MCLGRRPIPIGAEIARSTDQEAGKVALGPSASAIALQAIGAGVARVLAQCAASAACEGTDPFEGGEGQVALVIVDVDVGC